jgi:hypothetical protein
MMGKRTTPPLPNGSDQNAGNGAGTTTIDAPETISLEFEFVEPRPGNSNMRLDVSHMTLKQKIGLHFLTSALDKSGATLENGKRVTSAVEAFKCFCERLADQLPEDWKPDRYKAVAPSTSSAPSEPSE